jgi:hypothetical protein
MAVLMYDGSHGRHEGADLYMPNADINRTRVAPLANPAASIGALQTSSQRRERRLAGGCNTSNVRGDDVEEENWKVASDEALFLRVGQNSV